MRVALDVSAIPDRPAGAGVYVLELVRALGDLPDAAADLELVLVCRRGDDERWRRAAPAATVEPAVPARRPVRVVWEQLRGAALARRIGCDVWHGPHYTRPARLGVPSVVTVHDLTFFDHPEWHERSKVTFFRRMIRTAARRATVLVCVSEQTAARLRALLQPAGAVVVIPHGVDTERFRPDADEDADLRLLAGVGVRPPFVAFQGTLEPRKNVPALVRAFGRVTGASDGAGDDEHADLQLVLAGQDGWGVEEIDAAVEAAGLQGRVVRPGYVPADVVPALFRRAEVVAYPSHEEGFGLPALEAAACGAAVLTTAGSPMAALAGDAAVAVDAGDDDALAEGLRRLLGDGALRERLRVAGPRLAAAHTWRRCAERHVDAYRLAAHGVVAAGGR